MNNTIISIHDKKFTPLISEQEINEKIRVIAHQINNLCLQDIVLVSVLNGAFMFTAELCKHIDSFPIISFIKVASYQGTESTGNITQLIGLQENIEGKTVIIIEDIIDTGTTIDTIYNKCKE
ncbi:MAG TPA: phosphoribosyltransferase family protein, partial [Bacteroidales bacterium]|nr:phosphoribosyltransferase family protein [Bacteroidales bacterium]